MHSNSQISGATDVEIQKLKVDRLLKQLEHAQGDGTSLITLMIPAGGNINRMKQKLTDEYSAATQIKSRL